VEVVSGVPYEKFIDDRIFKPLGMKDTTFRPNKRQIALLAKSYKPNEAKTGLEETTINQLKYPLDDPARYPFAAGGLFSTASDFCRFGQMVLNGGVWKGKRIVSEAAIEEMTRKQTPESMTERYGLGWGVGGDGFGHGGAYATNFQIEPKHGLILIWMVQHAGFPNNGGESFEAFKNAANKAFSTTP
jgi:CubicO group peptidase (beta-lactamase class C family)